MSSSPKSERLDAPISLRPAKIAFFALSLGFAGVVSGAAPAPAQNMLNSGSGSDAVEIEADNGIEWLRSQQVYHARGNAVARRSGVDVHADELSAYYHDTQDGGNQQIYRMDANGHVVIVSGDTKAYGDKGVYYVDKHVAVLVGNNLHVDSPKAKITAKESLEYWEVRDLAVARGDATVTKEDNKLRAGVLTAYIRPDPKTGKKDVRRIDATGGVHISTKTEIVRGKEGVYDVVNEIATVCGNVKITRGDSQLNGECAQVNMKTGRSELKGGAGKVKGLLFPSQQQ